jgi:protoporphyrinogen oxidase
MADVIVVGGGITGLAAAYELEQQGMDYTLIEVKPRLGGSIISEKRDGFVLDGGPFVLHQVHDWPFMAQLGLEDAIYTVADLPDNTQLVAFKEGTQTLTDALASRLQRGRILKRMAVSTIGRVGGCYAACLENGMVMEAAALIITAPARFAERMFYSFQPEISARLRRFHYDTITRVSLGYRAGDIPLPIEPPPDPAYAFGRWTDSPYRVPAGHVLLQIGVRFPLDRSTPEALVQELARAMGWPPQPVVYRVDYWPESHSLAPHTPEHDAIMTEIENALPGGVALAGNDYRAARFEDRVLHGQQAASRVIEWLRSA